MQKRPRNYWKNMKILFVSSEVVPFAKTGGLADVAGALPKALSALGEEVIVFTPRYKKTDPVKFKLKSINPEISVGTLPGSKVKVYFFEHYDFFGSREELYQVKGCDYPDNLERFTAFCQKVLSFIKEIGWTPDVIHCNDWQTGLIPAHLKTGGSKIASVYSVHNMEYLGLFSKEKLLSTGLGWEEYTPEKMEFWNNISLGKAGLVYADAVCTVSETYAKEIQTPEYGCGLDGLLRERSKDVYGIVNGIDYDIWDPAIDPCIAKHYSADNIEDKLENKLELQKDFNLPMVAGIPLIGIVSRLADQKGFDILAGAIEEIMKLKCQLVLLGTGDPKYHKLFTEMMVKYPEHISVKLGFNAALAQQIYAGSDFFLMPSRYEPCGLGQLISFRYGTIPIVRNTGGLADTVHPGEGFIFEEYSSSALLDSIKRAVAFHKKNGAAWKEQLRRIMELDYSWGSSAKKYIELYRK